MANAYNLLLIGAGYLYLFGTLQVSVERVRTSQHKSGLTQSCANPITLQKSNTQASLDSVNKLATA